VSLKRALKSVWFSRAIFVVSIISAFIVYFMLKEIELIVHGQLYEYGLQFSPDWADPYRLWTCLIYVCLVLPVALSGVGLVLSFIRETGRGPEKKPAVEPKVKPVAKEAPKVFAAKEELKIVENANGDGISCPRCRKVFSKALVMLDFHSGKPKLVSVCPYCSYVLNKSEAGSEERREERKEERGR
jgi:hypothetical protein